MSRSNLNNTYTSKELSIHSDEYIDVCRLRYQNFFSTYLNEQCDLVEEIEGIPSLKPCKYDNHSIIFAVYNNDNQCIGSIRLIIRDSTQNHFLEIEESKINKLKPFVYNSLKVAEVGRLVVDKRYRNQTSVVFILFNCITQYSLQKRLDYLVCEAPAHLSKHYVRMGWEIIDENIPWPLNKHIILKHLFFDIKGHRVRAKLYGHIMNILVHKPHLYKIFFHY